MGTSGSTRGPGSNSALVPTFLNEPSIGPLPGGVDVVPADSAPSDGDDGQPVPADAPPRPAIVAPPVPPSFGTRGATSRHSPPPGAVTVVLFAALSGTMCAPARGAPPTPCR